MTSLTIHDGSTLTDEQAQFAAWLIAHLGQSVTAETRWGSAYTFLIGDVQIVNDLVFYTNFWRQPGEQDFRRGSLSQSDPYILTDAAGSTLSYIPRRYFDDDF